MLPEAFFAFIVSIVPPEIGPLFGITLKLSNPGILFTGVTALKSMNEYEVFWSTP